MLLLAGCVYQLFVFGAVAANRDDLSHLLQWTSYAKQYVGYQQLVVNVSRNFIVYYKSFDYLYNHYISGPYLDIVSRFLASVGFIVLLTKLKYRASYLTLFVYVLTCIVIGVTSPYWYTATTRGIFLLPFGFLFASLGADSVLGLITRFGLYWQRKKNLVLPLPVLFSGILATVVIVLNLYESQVGTFMRMGNHGVNSVLSRILDLQKAGIASPTAHVLISEKYSRSISYSVNVVVYLKKYYLKPIDLDVQTQVPKCDNERNSDILYFAKDHEMVDSISKYVCPNFKNIVKIDNYYLY